jgi:hypothetical protein
VECNPKTPHKIIEAIRINYNYCRVHSKLKMTPAEKAGIRLDLRGNKVEMLIKLSSTNYPPKSA